MNNDMWSYEPHYTQYNIAASPGFGRNGETLHMDTQPAYGFYSPSFGIGGQDGQSPLQTSPLEIQQSHGSGFVSPISPLKRNGSELLQIGGDGLARTSSKRSKNERLERRDDELYKCTWPGCKHRSSLMCEIRKHFSATHKPEEARPHGCPYCEKRFNWPKDVRRHKRQKHKDLTEAPQSVPAIADPPGLTTEGSFESDEIAQTPPEVSIQPEAPKKKKKLRLVGSLILALQSLSLGSKDTEYEEDDKSHIFVTHDNKNWHKVHLDGARTSENVMQKIKDVYHRHEGHKTSKFLLYRHDPNKPDKRIPENGLLSAVRQANDAHRTLKIVLWPILPSSDQVPVQSGLHSTN